jgi:aspartate/methionine/tyrosine aminotransferase
MKQFSKRVPNLGTENAFSVIEKAKKFELEVLKPKGKHLIYLQIGEPSFNTPKNINQATIRAINDNKTHYTPTLGLPELRTAVAEKTKKYTGVNYQKEDVIITAGAKPIIFYTINALIDKGDEVIIPNPAYPIYGSVTEYLGGKVIPLELKGENNFSLNTKELKKKITSKTKLIVLNSPQNPTGAVFPEKTIREVAKIAKQNDLWVLSDEIYHEIIHKGRHFSIASVPGMSERTIILNGVSKTYAMTGYRLGWGIIKNKKMIDLLERFACNDTSCPSSLAQYAALEAISGPQKEVKSMVKEYKKRRDLLVSLVNEIPGASCHFPEGAFYLMVDVAKILNKLKITGAELCDRIMKEAHVLILPGTVFGSFGENFVRFSYVSSEENIRKGVAQIKKYIASVYRE